MFDPKQFKLFTFDKIVASILTIQDTKPIITQKIYKMTQFTKLSTLYSSFTHLLLSIGPTELAGPESDSAFILSTINPLPSAVHGPMQRERGTQFYTFYQYNMNLNYRGAILFWGPEHYLMRVAVGGRSLRIAGIYQET